MTKDTSTDWESFLKSRLDPDQRVLKVDVDELVAFIKSTIQAERKKVAESLRLSEMKSKFKKSEGYNQAVRELNTKIDAITESEE